MAKGYKQVFGYDYSDTYAPMSRMTTIRVMMFICIQLGFICHQIDIATAYLNAVLDTIIFVEPSKGFYNDKSKCWRLLKSLYGLKQSARLWNTTLNEYLVSVGFRRSKADLCLYTKRDPRGLTIIIVFVDDIIVMASSIDLVEEFKAHIKTEFQIKDNGLLTYFLGIEFKFTDSTVQMSQELYCQSILDRFNMSNCFPQNTPCVSNIFHLLKEHRYDRPMSDPTLFRELVGSLLYLQQVSRPDISFIVNIIGRQMSSPNQFHWELGKHVLKYLQGTKSFSLNYRKTNKMQLTGLSDSDYANAIDGKSTSGYVFLLGDNNSPVSWRSGKQKLVSTSTCNAEYIALSECVCECLWLQFLLDDLRIKNLKYRPGNIFCDNTSACSLAQNPCHHNSSKHIEVKHHHVRDHVARQHILLTHIPSVQNLADGFTKSLPHAAFVKFPNKLRDYPKNP